MKIWLSSLLSPFGKGQTLTSPPFGKGGPVIFMQKGEPVIFIIPLWKRANINFPPLEKRGPVIFMQKGELVIFIIPLWKRGARGDFKNKCFLMIND
jgi:antitoxin (DNA-binding transcriptional repressor) of toxin-antitoxin stability system